MKEFQGGIRQEIRSLERRVEQLVDANAVTDRLLATLSQQADTARSGQDATGAQRIDRRASLVRQRRVRAEAEISTLNDLIAARRQRYVPAE